MNDNDAEIAFLKAIHDQPDDKTARLVYADWLDDRDDPRAGLIRLQTELAEKRYSREPDDVRRVAVLRRQEDEMVTSPVVTEVSTDPNIIERKTHWDPVALKWQSRLKELFPEIPMVPSVRHQNRKGINLYESQYELGIPVIYIRGDDYMREGHNLPFSAVAPYSCNLTADLFADTSPLQKVTHLSITGIQGSSEMLTRLGDLKKLEKLEVGTYYIPRQGWRAIVNSDLKIKELTLDGTFGNESYIPRPWHHYINISNAPAFSELQKLTLLDPAFPNVENFGRYWDTLFQNRPNLKELSFGDVRDGQGFIYFLHNALFRLPAPNLQAVGLKNCGINDNTVVSIFEANADFLSRLTHLDLSHNNVTNIPHLARVETNPSLRDAAIDFSHNGASDRERIKLPPERDGPK